MPTDLELRREVALSFRDQLREARLKAQGDAEGFEEVVFVVERLGCYLRKEEGTLWKYQPYIVGLASRSPLFHTVPDVFRELHIPFPILYDLVREARNSAMHVGAVARYATCHAVQLALVLEDALMKSYVRNSNDKVADFMVRNPVCAAMWQPLSFIRQTMLTSSFSSLPVNAGTDAEVSWQLVFDKALVQYLRLRPNGESLKELLLKPLEAARDGDKGILVPADTCHAGDAVTTVLKRWKGDAILVTHEETKELLGILTPYDLL